MELMEYAGIVQRRWKVVAGLTLATLIASAAFALAGPTAYRAEYTLAVSVLPEPRTGPYFTYSGYYEWLSSEYLADDLSRLIESEAFAEEVSAVLGEQVDASSVAGTTRVRKTHRILDVAITDASRERALAIARAHEQVLNTRLGHYLAQLKADNGQVRMINPPRVQRATSLTGLVLQVGVRTLAGLLAGIGLAFVLHYLDRTVREPLEAEQLLGAPVLGHIPLGPDLA